MTPVMRWPIDHFISTGKVDLSLALRREAGVRDYVVCIEGVDSTEFIDTNPGWNYSERLRKPFKYVPALEVAPGIIGVGIIVLPSNTPGAALTAQDWRPSATPVAEIFDAAIVRPVGGPGLERAHIVGGHIEGEA